MKRVLTFILVLSMVLGSLGTVFAAPESNFVDIDDKDVAKAVDRLEAFGIVDGYGDGTYRPDQEVTREEFAKLLVTALGIEHAADATSYTKFPDVEAGRWSAGYIAVAAGQGLVIGYPDGTFKPSNKVTYAEAVTMLVRALGYKDEFLPEGWPGNYIAKAAETGITSRVRFANASGYANRGDVALLVDNTLDAYTIKVDTYEGAVIKYYESKVTLLEDKLEIYNLEEVVVTGTPAVDNGINKGQIRVECTKDLDFAKASKSYEEGDIRVFDVINDDIEIDSLLGLSLNVYVNDKDDVIYVEESRRAYTVLYDVVDHKEDIEEDSITLKNADREYQFETGKKEGEYKIYLDNKSVSFRDFKETAKTGGLFVKAVLNNKGNIKLVEAHRFEVKGEVVTENKNDIVTYFENEEDDEYKVKAKDYDKVVVFDMEGNVMDFEDIEVDDVIYVNDKGMDGKDLKESATRDEVAYILVVRDTIEGIAESYREVKPAIEIDGKFYDIAGPNKTTVSIDDDAKIILFGDAIDRELDDLTGEEGNVIALLDFVGDIRHIRSDVKASSKDTYGVITGIDTRYSDIYVKMLNYDEKTVEYELDLDYAYGYNAGNFTAESNFKPSENAEKLYTDSSQSGKGVAKGDIVRYTLNSKGDINEIELLAYFGGSDFKKPSFGQSKNLGLVLDKVAGGHDIAKKSIEVGGSYYAVKDDIVVFNYTPAYENNVLGKPSDVEVTNWSDIVDKHVEKETLVLVVNDTRRGAAELVVFLTKFDAIGDDAFAGYVTNVMIKDGDYFAEIVKSGEDEAIRYEINSKTEYDKFERRNVAIFTEKSNGKIVYGAKSEKGLSTFTDKVKAVRGRSLEFSNGKTYRLSSDAIFYQKGAEKSLSDISAEDYVRVVIEKGVIAVVKRYDFRDITKPSAERDAFLKDYEADSESKWDEDIEENGDNGEVVGTVTYINATKNQMVIDGKIYKSNDDTVVYDKDGKIIALGSFAGISEGDEIKVDGNRFTVVRKAEDKKNQDKADEVKDIIDELPTVEELEISDKVAVQAAREAYNALTEAQKALVPAEAVEALEAAEAKIEELETPPTGDEITGVEVAEGNFILNPIVGGTIVGKVIGEVEDFTQYTVKVDKLGSGKVAENGVFEFELNDDLATRLAKKYTIIVLDKNEKEIYRESKTY